MEETPQLARLMGEASSFSVPVDNIFIVWLIISGVVSLGIIFFIVFFSVKYRRNAKVNRAVIRSSRPLERAWIFIPLAIFLAFFVWSANIYIGYFGPTKESDLEIKVVAKQWMWKIYHSKGKEEINELHIPVGRTVQLTLISRDVIHSFFIPAFRKKHDVLPRHYYTMWLRPLETGVYRLFCAEYCGMGHAHMKGRIIVMEPSAYARWLGQ